MPDMGNADWYTGSLDAGVQRALAMGAPLPPGYAAENPGFANAYRMAEPVETRGGGMSYETGRGGLIRQLYQGEAERQKREQQAQQQQAQRQHLQSLILALARQAQPQQPAARRPQAGEDDQALRDAYRGASYGTGM